MVLRAQAVHRVNQYAEFVRVDIRCDAVTQVENMARAIAIACQHLCHAFLDLFGRFTQRRRVEISLQRHVVAGVGPCVGQVSGPVNTQRVAAYLPLWSVRARANRLISGKPSCACSTKGNPEGSRPGFLD